MYNAVEESVTSKINFKGSEWPSAAKNKIPVEDSSKECILYHSKESGLHPLSNEVQQDDI